MYTPTEELQYKNYREQKEYITDKLNANIKKLISWEICLAWFSKT